MLVSVVIVNYNTFALSCQCIDSVIRHTQGCDYEIVLVDNRSPNEDPEAFRTRYPQLKLVKSTVNGGFAHGNNLGIRHAKGDVILLLNSDTILTEDAISQSAQRLLSDTAPVLTVKLVYEDGKYQSNARRFRSLRNELLDLARPLLLLVPYRTRAKLMMNQYFRGDFDTRCDWVSGAYLMFRRTLVDSMPGGMLDERFFMYSEDELWCYQAAPQGDGCLFVSGVSVIHIANASTTPEDMMKKRVRLLRQELELLRFMHGNGLYNRALSSVYFAKERMRDAVKLLVYKLSGKKIR